MIAFVAFLRGINVGGNKLIAMAALKTLFERLGLEGVRTHLNSGNVVFLAKTTSKPKLVKTIASAMQKEFGFAPAIIVRSATELKTVIDENPFPEAAKNDPSHLLVMFLDARPDDDATAHLAKVHAGPEQIRLFGETVYVTYPNGIGRSKLTNVLLEKQLGVTGTARNWNTVVKLLEIAEAIEPT